MSRRKQSRPNRVHDEDAKCNLTEIRAPTVNISLYQKDNLSETTKKVAFIINKSIDCSEFLKNTNSDKTNALEKKNSNSLEMTDVKLVNKTNANLVKSKENFDFEKKSQCKELDIFPTVQNAPEQNGPISSGHDSLVDSTADKNNNNSTDSCSIKEEVKNSNDNRNAIDLSQGRQMTLTIPQLVPPVPPPPPTVTPFGHMTFENLQNAKAAIAQFAATTLANGPPDEDALKELAVLQSTLFNLHNQHFFQIQLIQQLQSQLTVNNLPDDKHFENEHEYQLNGRIFGNSPDSEQPIDLQKKTNFREEEKECRKSSELICMENKERTNKTDNENELQAKVRVDNEKLSSRSNSPLEAAPKPEPEIKKEHEFPPAEKRSAMDTTIGMCQISSSLASAIITNHDPPPSLDEPNSLEMLQKRAQEVLDSASKGLLAGNLADELAFRRDLSQDGKGKNEPFFKHRCRYCGKVFGSDSALQIHVRSHTGERPFKCNVCSSRFTTKGNLKVHYQRHTQRYPIIPINHPHFTEHGGIPNIVTQTTSGPISQSTSNGGNIFSMAVGPLRMPFSACVGLPPFAALPNIKMSRELISHKIDSILDSSLQKSTTDSALDEPTDLRLHAKSSELGPSNGGIENIDNNCDFISNKEDESLSSRFNEDYSMDSSKFSDQEQPENLSKISVRSSISRNSTFSEPVKEHATIPVTGTDFPALTKLDNSWESLIEIEKTSETSKLQQLVDNIENKLTDPNQCVFCQKILSCRSALQMHYRTHTGERPYRCRICGRAFATKGNLKAHMSIHKIRTPIRSQFKCPICHNKYSNAVILQQHIRTHTGEMTDVGSEQVEAVGVHEERLSPSSSVLRSNNEDSALEYSATKSESSQGDFPDDFLDCDDDVDEDDDIQYMNEKDSFHSHLSSPALSKNNSQTHNDESLQTDPLKISERNHKSQQELHPQIKSESVSDSRPSSACKTSAQPLCTDSTDVALDLTPKSSVTLSDNVRQNFEQKSLSFSSSPLAATLNGAQHFGFLQKFPFLLYEQPPGLTKQPTLNDKASSPFYGTFTKRDLATHNHGNTMCSICFKTFSTTSALEAHFLSHSKDKPYQCAICDQTFSTKREEITHTTLHYINTKDGKLKQSILSQKSREDSISKSLQENDGPSISKNIKLESTHNISHHKEVKSNNLKKLGSPSQLLSSVNSTENNSSDRNGLLDVKSSLSDIEESLSAPKIHDQLSLSNKSPNSQNTDNVNGSQGTVSDRIPSAENSFLNTTNSFANYDTPNTMQVPTTLQHLQQLQPPSLQLQTSQKDFQSLNFHDNSQNLNNMSGGIIMDQNQINMKHYCSICRKNFSSSSALQIHMRTHTGDKPFRCSVCQKAFTTKGNLKVHMGTHMWTNGASRRGRRMSLELPLHHRPMPPLGAQDAEFLQRRPDMFYPYMPPFLNGLHQKFRDMNGLQAPPPGQGFPVGVLPPGISTKYAGLIGFNGHFMPGSMLNPNCLSPISLNGHDPKLSPDSNSQSEHSQNESVSPSNLNTSQDEHHSVRDVDEINEPKIWGIPYEMPSNDSQRERDSGSSERSDPPILPHTQSSRFEGLTT